MTQQGGDEKDFDVTDALRATASLLQVHRGLYVQYFENPSTTEAVHDRNGEWDGGGKRLIEPGGTTIKLGKFEDGMLRRRADDAIHMHHRPVVPPESPHDDEFVYAPALDTYLTCLRRSFLLDLGSIPRERVHDAEKQLRIDLNAFLKASPGLQVQDYRGDWRLVRQPVPNDLFERVGAWVRAEFETLRTRYLRQ